MSLDTVKLPHHRYYTYRERRLGERRNQLINRFAVFVVLAILASAFL